jgi:hypothetical protein
MASPVRLTNFQCGIGKKLWKREEKSDKAATIGKSEEFCAESQGDFFFGGR